MQRLSMILIGLLTSAALAQTSMNGNSSMGSSMNGMSMSGSSMSGNSMSGGSMNDMSMDGTSSMGNSMNGGSMSGSSMNGMSMSGGSMMASAVDNQFIIAAAQGNTFEIEAAKVALMNSSNAKVKSFAQKMITDHTKLGLDVKMAVAKDEPAMRLPTSTTAAQSVMLAKLRTLKGAAFDASYKNMMVSSHAETYGLFSNYVKTGKLPNLKKAIQSGLPTVKMHWDMAKVLPST